MTSRLCRNCEAAWARQYKARCAACDRYLQRTGRERPDELVVAHGMRVLDNHLSTGRHSIRVG